MKPWEKYGGAEPEASPGPWAKYAALAEAPAPRAEPTNPAAANPEVITPVGTIKGEMGENARFNPAAALIKAGEGFSKLNRGIIEAKEYLPSLIRGRDSPLLEKIRAEQEFARQPMQELEAVHPGSTQIGDVVQKAVIPAAALPVVAALEEGNIGERAMRAGAAYAGNKLAQKSGEYLAKAPERAAAQKSANSVRDALVKEAKDAGLVLPPSATGGGWVSRSLEGVSGKAKTEQLGTVKNQPIIDTLIRRDLKLADDIPVTPEVLQSVRAQAYDTGYRPIADMPVVNGDTALLNKLRSLAPGSSGGAIKSPARAEIDDMVGALASKGQWTGKELVQDIQALREQSRALYGAADRAGGDAAKTALAKAQKDAADMLEHLAERNVIANGGKAGAVKDLRDARTLIAKAHNAEDALVNGSFDAMKIKGHTGGMAMIEKLAADKGMKKSIAMPVAGANVPITAADSFGVAALSALDGGIMSLGLPVGRVAARYGIMSGPAQRFINPNYDPSLLSRGGARLLDNKLAPALAGMYGYEMANR